jgi:hypothetical protein
MTPHLPTLPLLKENPRDDLFAGNLFKLPVCGAVNTLILAIHNRLVQATGCDDPPSVLDVMEPVELWTKLSDLRREIAEPSWEPHSIGIIKAADLPFANVLIDGLRLRVVVPATNEYHR